MAPTGAGRELVSITKLNVQFGRWEQEDRSGRAKSGATDGLNRVSALVQEGPCPSLMEENRGMKTIILGRSGLRVSRVAFGAWQLGGEWGGFDEDGAIAAIRQARELGVNFFDTAQAYGFGASERLFGRALRDELTAHRDQLVIATKGGLRMTDTGLVRDASPRWLRAGVEASLRALGVDHIDLYQVHWPDPTVPAAETAGALRRAGGRGQDRPRRGVQLRRGADGRVRRDAARGDPAAALSPVPPRHRRGGAALQPGARHRCAGLRAAGPRPADRHDERGHHIRPR